MERAAEFANRFHLAAAAQRYMETMNMNPQVIVNSDTLSFEVVFDEFGLVQPDDNRFIRAFVDPDGLIVQTGRVWLSVAGDEGLRTNLFNTFVVHGNMVRMCVGLFVLRKIDTFPASYRAIVNMALDFLSIAYVLNSPEWVRFQLSSITIRGDINRDGIRGRTGYQDPTVDDDV